LFIIIIPTYAQKSSVKLILKLLRQVSVLYGILGVLTIVFAKVINY